MALWRTIFFLMQVIVDQLFTKIYKVFFQWVVIFGILLRFIYMNCFYFRNDVRQHIREQFFVTGKAVQQRHLQGVLDVCGHRRRSGEGPLSGDNTATVERVPQIPPRRQGFDLDLQNIAQHSHFVQTQKDSARTAP